MRALFIDFEDSFTFNVVQELAEIGWEVELMNWKDFSTLGDHELLVLGPGPGHPDDYQRIYPLVQSWLDLGKRVFGLCLGHQILWKMKGENVGRSKDPLHGQKVRLLLNPDWQSWLDLPQEVWVQRYNSLAVFAPVAPDPGIINFVVQDEVVMTRSSQLLSYQFHPESVGTMCRKSFFLPLLRDHL